MKKRALLGLIALLPVGTLSAANMNWTGDTGNWRDDTWNPDGATTYPTSADTAIINNDGYVTITEAEAITALQMSGSSFANTLEIALGGSLNISGAAHIGLDASTFGTLIVNGDNDDETENVHLHTGGILTVGRNGSGALLINSGALVTTGTTNSHHAIIGDPNTATTHPSGLATVRGEWRITGQLQVGKGTVAATGTLHIDGGKVVSGNQNLVGMETNGAGFITIENSGLWETSGATHIGHNGTGTLTVTGEDSSWTSTSTATIGNQVGSTGTAYITEGGTVSTTTLIVGNNGTGTLAVNGENSSWTATSTATIGNNRGSNGTVHVTNGGVVTSTGLTLGSQGATTDPVAPAAVGTLNIDGTGSKWTTTSLTVGGSGTGTINITDGGLLETAGGTVGSVAGSNGTVTIGGTGSKWNSTNNITIGNNGVGALYITAGGLVETIGSNRSLIIGTTANVSTPLTPNSGYVSVDGTNARLVIGNELVMGDAKGNATLVINNGGSVEANGTLKIATSGEALVEVIHGTLESLSSAITLGGVDGGKGTWNIGSGGAVTSAQNTNVGMNGEGILSIAEGATLTTGAHGIIGNQSATANGKATVSGTWTMNQLGVGYSGRGELTIESTGVVISTVNSVIGNGRSLTGYGDGTMTVRGAYTLTPPTGTANLTVGATGKGELFVDGGTVTVTAGALSIGANQGTINHGTTEEPDLETVWGQGRVIINNGTLSTSSNVTVGAQGEGELTISETAGVLTVNNGTGTVTLANHANARKGVLNIGGEEGETATVAGRLNAAIVTSNTGTPFGIARLNFNHTSNNYLFQNSANTNIAIQNRVEVHVYSGTTTLGQASNSYSGGTTVHGGTLLVNTGSGSGTGSGAVAINGGTFGGESTGNARITGDLQLGAGGNLAPGATLGAIGTLAATNLIWDDGATITLQLGEDNTAANSDGLTLSGAFTKGLADGDNVWQFTFLNAPTAIAETTYTLVSFLSESSNFQVDDFSYVYGGSGLIDGYFSLNDDSLQFTVTSVQAIPEPGVSALLLFGAAGLVGYRRFRKPTA